MTDGENEGGGGGVGGGCVSEQFGLKKDPT